MPGFWELPEVQGPRLKADCFSPLGIQKQQQLATFRHAITFREYQGSVYRGKLAVQPPDGYRWVSPERLKRLPLTTITRKALAVARGLAARGKSRAGEKNGDCHQFAPVIALETKYLA